MVYASRYLRLAVPRMQGPDVLDAQRLLRERGFDPGPLDGIYGERTEAAVRAFQSANGLLVDGIVGPATWSRLRIGAPEPQYRIAVDVDQRILTLRRDQALVKRYPVAVGRPETPTPTGDWVITEKVVNPGGPFGARWMRISVPWGGYGIHGTDNPASIGTAASHGCIRMYNEDVIELYNLVPVGTPVRITGTAATGRILAESVAPGRDIEEVQRKLAVLGYYRGDIDGVYGPLTRQAVANFQRDQGLAADGIVGPLTYQALQKAYDIATGNQQP